MMIKESTAEFAKASPFNYDIYAQAKSRARTKFIENYKLAYYKRKFTDQCKSPAWCPPSFAHNMEVVDAKSATKHDKIFLFTIRVPDVDHHWYKLYMNKFTNYKNVRDTDIIWQFEDKKKDGTDTGLHIHAVLHNITAQTHKQFIDSMWAAYNFMLKKYPDITPYANSRAWDVKTKRSYQEAYDYVHKNVKPLDTTVVVSESESPLTG